MADTFEFSLRIRYMEVDAQGVVFNAWYLTYFDDAFTAFLESRGLDYQALLGQGFDTQLVRAEIDWQAGLRWQDRARIAVSTARLGRTSFAIDFEASRNDTEVACRARIVYVVVATDGSGKREIPAMLIEALGTPAPLLPLLSPYPVPSGTAPDQGPTLPDSVRRRATSPDASTWLTCGSRT